MEKMENNFKDILLLLGGKSIFLTGFMGSGKSTIGKTLSKQLSIPHYDLDYLIERQQGVLVSEIFKFDGEGNFREIESTVLEVLFEEPGPNVISLGGGSLISEVNRARVRNKGFLIALRATPESIIPRLNEGQIATLMMMTSRPISDSLFSEKIAEAVNELIELRKPIYEDVNFSVDTDNRDYDDILADIVTNLAQQLNNQVD